MKRRRPRSKSVFSCGHARSPDNIRLVRGRGYSWQRCRKCNNAYMRAYMRGLKRRRMQQRIARLKRALDEAKTERFTQKQA